MEVMTGTVLVFLGRKKHYLVSPIAIQDRAPFAQSHFINVMAFKLNI